MPTCSKKDAAYRNDYAASPNIVKFWSCIPYLERFWIQQLYDEFTGGRAYVFEQELLETGSIFTNEIFATIRLNNFCTVYRCPKRIEIIDDIPFIVIDTDNPTTQKYANVVGTPQAYLLSCPCFQRNFMR